MDSGNLSSDVVWGWERFFTELSVILNTAERQRVTAAYSQYVLERLETTLLSLSALMEIRFVCILTISINAISINADKLSNLSVLRKAEGVA